MTRHYVLTAADIADLRASVRRMNDGCGNMTDAPFIVYSPPDDRYYLHCRGYVWCSHDRVEVIAAVMRAERLERGWMAKAFDTADTPIEVLMGVEDRAALRASKAEHAAKTKLALASKRDLADTTLDDFLS